MTITQEQLIHDIAQKEDLNIATVRRVLLSLEDNIFHYLTLTAPSEDITIKPLKGLSLECRYIPAKQIHTYEDIDCQERIWTKPKITRYYNRKLNQSLNHDI